MERESLNVANKPAKKLIREEDNLFDDIGQNVKKDAILSKNNKTSKVKQNGVENKETKTQKSKKSKESPANSLEMVTDRKKTKILELQKEAEMFLESRKKEKKKKKEMPNDNDLMTVLSKDKKKRLTQEIMSGIEKEQTNFPTELNGRKKLSDIKKNVHPPPVSDQILDENKLVENGLNEQAIKEVLNGDELSIGDEINSGHVTTLNGKLTNEPENVISVDTTSKENDVSTLQEIDDLFPPDEKPKKSKSTNGKISKTVSENAMSSPKKEKQKETSSQRARGSRDRTTKKLTKNQSRESSRSISPSKDKTSANSPGGELDHFDGNGRSPSPGKIQKSKKSKQSTADEVHGVKEDEDFGDPQVSKAAAKNFSVDDMLSNVARRYDEDGEEFDDDVFLADSLPKFAR